MSGNVLCDVMLLLVWCNLLYIIARLDFSYVYYTFVTSGRADVIITE